MRKRALMLLASVALASACSESTLPGPVMGQPDAAPSVVRIEPAAGKTGVPLDATALIVFSEPMDSVTLVRGSIKLLLDEKVVLGLVSIADRQRSMAVFTPASRLAPDTEYTIVVTTDARDAGGRAIEVPLNSRFVTEPARIDEGSAQFLTVGDMTRARVGHTATLLEDGRVLVTGGDGGLNTPGSTAEVYDPATKTFTQTGSLLQPRMMHQAVLLPSGKVLIVGGWNQSAGAELYDPATGAFSATGHPVIRQFVTGATLLRDGRVLVTGYYGAELYSPGTGTFRLAEGYVYMGPVWDELWYYPVALADGRVLMHGMPDCAQIYDPRTDKFSMTGCLGVAGLELHTSTLLADGRVLVAGGGNDETGGRSAYALLFDPASGSFTRTGNLVQNRAAHAAVRLADGKVLIVGGDHNAGGAFAGALTAAELYDPAVGRFSSAGSMHVQRSLPRATLLKNGDVLITGGTTAYSPCCTFTRTAEVYRP